MNSAEKYNKAKTGLIMFQCSAAIENNDIWDVEGVFVLYTTSRCELAPLQIPIIPHVKKKKKKTAVIITPSFWLKMFYS